MGNTYTSPDVVKQHYQTQATSGATAQRVYQGQILKAGEFLNPSMDVRYGGKRVSRLPDGVNKQLLAMSLLFDVSGSNFKVAQIMHRDFPQFWELLAYLLPPDKYHFNLQLGAIDDFQDDAAVQLSQFEADGTKVERWLSDLFPVGHGWSNAVEGYLEALWMLLNQNDIESGAIKPFAFVMFDEAFEPHFMSDWLHGYYNASQAAAQVDGISANMSQPTKLNLPPRGVNITAQELFTQMKQRYHFYGIQCTQVNSYGLDYAARIHKEWGALLGEANLLTISDSANISELVASVVARNLGVGKQRILSALDSSGTLIGAGKSEISTALDLVKPSTGLITNTNIKRI
jgi:hypothetical protein